jgi:hypothetical protein
VIDELERVADRLQRFGARRRGEYPGPMGLRFTVIQPRGGRVTEQATPEPDEPTEPIPPDDDPDGDGDEGDGDQADDDTA